MKTDLIARLHSWILLTEMGLAKVRIEHPDLPNIEFALVATGGGLGHVATQWEVGSFIGDLKQLTQYPEMGKNDDTAPDVDLPVGIAEAKHDGPTWFLNLPDGRQLRLAETHEGDFTVERCDDPDEEAIRSLNPSLEAE